MAERMCDSAPLYGCIIMLLGFVLVAGLGSILVFH